MKTVKASLIVGDTGYFNHDTGLHSVERILNNIKVSYLPCSIKTFVLIKLLLPSYDYEEEAYLDVIAPDGMNDMNSSLIPIKNYRPNNMFPGMDVSMEVNFPVVELGNYSYKLGIKGKVIAEYPLFVGLNENEKI